MANVTTVATVKKHLENVNVKKRFEDMLGKKAPTFMASIVNAVSTNQSLQRCEPSSIMSSAFVAASFDLPIDANLGFCALVPYKVRGEYKAQFQMMYRGFVQLAIRTAQYEAMNASEVYEDELISYNPISKETQFVSEFKKDSQRANGEHDKVVGYYAWFRLRNGFKQSLYMTTEEVECHAREYSQAYGYDLREKKKSSKWSTDFDAMARKTVIKLLLSRWGILSIDMQRALTEDQKVHTEEGSNYGDNPEVARKQIEDPFAKKEGENETESSEAPAPKQEEKVSKNYVATLEKVIKTLNLQQKDVDAYLIDYNVSDIKDLTVTQAQELLKALSLRLDSK